MPETPVEKLRRRLPELQAAFAPTHVILFGSHSRGQATETSDVDMLLVAERFREVEQVNRHRLLFQVMWNDRSVDAICLTPEEFEKLRHWPGIVNTACEEGIWL